MPIETNTSLLSPSMQPSSSASSFAETLLPTPKPFNTINPLGQTSFSAFVNQFSRPQRNNNPPQNASQNSQNEETSQNTSSNTQNSNQTQTAQTSSSNTSQQKTTEQANTRPSQQNQQANASSSTSSKTDSKKTASTDKNSKDKKTDNTANAQNQLTPLVVEIAAQLPVQAETSKESAHDESSAATLAHTAQALLAETKQEQKTDLALKPLSAETKQALLAKGKTDPQGANASVSNIQVSHTPQHTSLSSSSTSFSAMMAAAEAQKESSSKQEDKTSTKKQDSLLTAPEATTAQATTKISPLLEARNENNHSLDLSQNGENASNTPSKQSSDIPNNVAFSFAQEIHNQATPPTPPTTPTPLPTPEATPLTPSLVQINNGTTSISMTVMTSDSTPVQVHLEGVDGTTTNVVLQSADAATTQHLSHSKHELIAALNAAGISVENLKIDVVSASNNSNQTNDQNMNNNNNAFNGSSGWSAGSGNPQQGQGGHASHGHSQQQGFSQTQASSTTLLPPTENGDILHRTSLGGQTGINITA